MSETTTTPCFAYKGRPIRLIGISGKIGSGKTTLATYLQQRVADQQHARGDDSNNNAIPLKKVSFAENLRRMVALMLNIDVEQTRSAEDKAVRPEGWGLTVGELLQKMGTEVARHICPDAWVLSLFACFDPEQSFWICDDVRFPNEADKIKAMGGLLIRLEGDPGGVRAELGKTRDLSHASETALDDYQGFDVVLNTEDYLGNLDALYEAIFDVR
jgi:hypothetical protein